MSKLIIRVLLISSISLLIATMFGLSKKYSFDIEQTYPCGCVNGFQSVTKEDSRKGSILKILGLP